MLNEGGPQKAAAATDFERRDTVNAKAPQGITRDSAPAQQFEKAPTSDINNSSGGEELNRQATLYHSANPGTGDIQIQIAAYKKMIDQENEEIKHLKQQISKKGENMSKTNGGPGGSSAVPSDWTDDVASSGKKFKFFHLIIVSILFLFLGRYLAQIPTFETPSVEEPMAADQNGSAEVNEVSAEASATIATD